MGKTETAKKDLVKFLRDQKSWEVNSGEDVGVIAEKNAQEFAELLVKLIKSVIEDTGFYVPSGSFVQQVVGQATGILNSSMVEIIKKTE